MQGKKDTGKCIQFEKKKTAGQFVLPGGFCCYQLGILPREESSTRLQSK